MSEHLRDRLHQEMAGQQPPPAGDLVACAVAAAVHTRKVRRTASGVGAVAVVGLTVLALTVGSQIRAGSGASSSTSQAGSPAAAHAVTKRAPKALAPATVKPATVATATTSAPAGTAAGKAAAGLAYRALQAAASTANPPQWTAAPSGVPATPAGELQLFTDLAKPYGSAGSYAVSSDADKTHVKAYLTNAAGRTGMLKFSLYHDTLGYAADCVPLGSPNRIACHHTRGGGYVVTSNDHAGCVNTADITVVHPDGTAVWVFLASCLTDAANQVTQGTQTLSAAQAEAIFRDPRFDFTMPVDVVTRAAKNIRDLATF